MGEFVGRTAYAVQLATPHVAHALYDVCKAYDCDTTWGSLAEPTAGPRVDAICAVPRGEYRNLYGLDVMAGGEFFLDEHVHQLSRFGVEPSRKIGRVRLDVRVHATFGITQGLLMDGQGLKALRTEAMLVSLSDTTRVVAIDTQAGVLAIAIDAPKSVRTLAHQLADGWRYQGTVTVQVPESGFCEDDDKQRFLEDRGQFSGLESRDASGRRWETEAKLTFSGAISDRITGRSWRDMAKHDVFVVPTPIKHAAWLPNGQEGPIVPLPPFLVSSH